MMNCNLFSTGALYGALWSLQAAHGFVAPSTITKSSSVTELHVRSSFQDQSGYGYQDGMGYTDNRHVGGGPMYANDRYGGGEFGGPRYGYGVDNNFGPRGMPMMNGGMPPYEDGCMGMNAPYDFPYAPGRFDRYEQGRGARGLYSSRMNGRYGGDPIAIDVEYDTFGSSRDRRRRLDERFSMSAPIGRNSYRGRYNSNHHEGGGYRSTSHRRNHNNFNSNNRYDNQADMDMNPSSYNSVTRENDYRRSSRAYNNNDYSPGGNDDMFSSRNDNHHYNNNYSAQSGDFYGVGSYNGNFNNNKGFSPPRRNGSNSYQSSVFGGGSWKRDDQYRSNSVR